MVLTCAVCSTENPDGARFCNACGNRLEPQAVEEARKTVTVLFCDVAGSTGLGERLDPERLQAVMSRFYAAVREPVERHGGRVEKVIGDALMAVFGIPAVHEDDALRAVRAALDARDAVRALGEVQARIGVNTGEVLTRDPARNETLVVGDAVNLAARLEQAAQPGEVLVGEATWQLVGHAVRGVRVGPLAAKGKRDPVHAWRLEHVDADARAHRRRLDAPMVGRAAEVELLRTALDRCASTRRPHLVTILGHAGIGKSRLVAEVDRLAPGARVLRGQCRDGGSASSLAPLLEATSDWAGQVDRLMPGDADADAIAACLSGRDGGRDVAWAATRLIAAMAAEGMVVVALEDVHWADDQLLDVIDGLIARSRRLPLLVVCTARPEFADRRPAFGAGANTLSFALERLDDEETRRILANAGADLDPDQIEDVIATAEGNPLFAEHLAALVSEGAAPQPSRSIQVLLTARLEALPASRREVVGAASVVGREFPLAAVEALAGRAIDEDVDELDRRDLFEVADAGSARFTHALLQDAAYALLSKQRRCDLHVRLARWLDAADASDGAVAMHLDRAVTLRADLGPLDEDALTLRTEAGVRLTRAGRRADALGDPPRARALLVRAVERLPDPTPARAAALVELAAAGWNLVSLPETVRLLDEGEALAAACGLRALQLRAEILRVGGGSDIGDAELLASTEEPLVELRELGDARALATCFTTRSEAEWGLGRAADSAASAHAALDALRTIDDDVVWALRALVRALNESPTPVAASEDILAALMEEFGRRPAARSELLQGQAMLSLLAGREAEAWARLDAVRELERDLLRTATRRLLLLEALMAYRAGRFAEVRIASQPVIDELDRLGSGWGAELVRSRVVMAEVRLGEFGEVARSAAAAVEYEAFVRSRAGLAAMRLAELDVPGAEAAAREALARALEGDWVLLQIEANAVLARVLAAAGDPAAADYLAAARAMCDAKGVAGIARDALLSA
jgi:class 3 adenylate cyclase